MSDMDTTALDGASCALCGDDAVWMPTIAEGSVLTDVPLCGACSDDQTTLCPGCDHRIFQKDGIRVYSGPDLYCRSCSDKKEAAFVASWDRAHKQDVARDEMDSIRRG